MVLVGMRTPLRKARDVHFDCVILKLGLQPGMSRLGCTHPHGCIEMARKLVAAIAPGWRPATLDEQTPPRPGQEGTHETTLEETEVLVDDQLEVTDLENSIRIFADARDIMDEMERSKNEGEQSHSGETIVYTDGSGPQQRDR